MTNTVLALSKACLHCTLIKVKMFNYKSSISPVFLVLSSSRTDKLADILLEMQPLRHVFTPPQAWSEPRLRWSDHFGRKRKARLWQKHKESQRRDVEPRRLFPAFIPHRGVSRGAGRGLWVGWVGQSVRDVSFKMLAWKPPSGKMWRESLISSMEMFTSSMCVRSDLRHSAPCVASMKGRRQTWGFKAADTTSLKQILKKSTPGCIQLRVLFHLGGDTGPNGGCSGGACRRRGEPDWLWAVSFWHQVFRKGAKMQLIIACCYET